MNIRTTKRFDKQYSKLRVNEKKRVDKSLSLFMKNIFHPLLNNHALHGKYTGCSSINAGGDLRIVFQERKGEVIILLTLGSHSQLY